MFDLPPQDDKQEKKAWLLLEKAVLASTVEQRRSRRWGILFKSLTFLYLFVILLTFVAGMNATNEATGEHAAVIEIRGVIADNEDASADRIIGALRNAYKNPDVKAIIFRINSPGGSPVQSGYVYDEINRLRALHPDIKVYAVITDIGASGAYYIASAADQIYADKASLVGSIGVTGAGFGFVGAMEKLGVERRSYTSGEHKAFLDPFQPLKQDEAQFWDGVLGTVHKQFIEVVKKGRGDRLKETPDLFSGLIWSGEQALTMGLIDGLGSSSYVARDVAKIPEGRLVNYTVTDSPLDRFAKKLGASISSELATKMGMQATPRLQ
ncbi:S49 family peptidase [Pseudomonas sp. F1_0610]|uniref:S49 family peptidase n=1 Tax=Pseudomonas sp. F1_0610 TaxID=3114284 RepID=UPI0039C09A69